MKFVKNHPDSYYLLTLICIVLLGTFFRFFYTPDHYTFDTDGIRDAIVAYEGAKNFSFPLAGPFSSTGPYTFGPLYYFSIILASLILPTNYAPWILMGILSLFTIILMADIGRLLHSKTLGIVLAILTAIAPTQISVAMGLSNINPVSFFATLSIWITLKLIKREATHYIWYLFLGLALGMGINTHYQMVGLLWLPLLLWLILGWKKYYIPLLIALGSLVTFVPLLIFNLLTGWHTLKGIEEMYIAKERIYVPNSWKIYLIEFWTSHLQFIFFSPIFINVTIIVIFLASLVKDVITKKYSLGLIILGIIFLLNFLGLRYYWGERNDVYLSYLSPILFIFMGYALVFLWEIKYGKALFVVLSFFIGGNMLITDYMRIKGSAKAESIYWKKEVQMLRDKYPNHNITLYSCNTKYEAHKKTLVYFLTLNYKQQAEEKKIAMKGHGCIYPSTKEFDFRNPKVINKYGTTIYPPVLPKIRDENFHFIDISVATPSAIKKAGWKSITTNDVFNESVNWWK